MGTFRCRIIDIHKLSFKIKRSYIYIHLAFHFFLDNPNLKLRFEGIIYVGL